MDAWRARRREGRGGRPREATWGNCWSKKLHLLKPLLPADLLVYIFGVLEVLDIFTSGVHASFLEARRLGICSSNPGPCLVFSSGDRDPSVATLHSLTTGKNYYVTMPDPPFRTRYIVGSSDGWLITADERSNLLLVNPATQAQIPMPPPETIANVRIRCNGEGVPHGYDLFRMDMSSRDFDTETEPDDLSWEEGRFYFYMRVVLSADPSSGNCTVTILHLLRNLLFFARVGDTHWTWINVNELCWNYHDVLYNDDDGLFYAIRGNGDVHAINTNGPSPILRVVLDAKSSLVDCAKYIVLSELGDLLQARRLGICSSNPGPCLVFSSCDRDPSVATLHSLAMGKDYYVTMPDPPFRARYIVGSSHDWFITAYERSNLLLVNPATQAQITMPPLETIANVRIRCNGEGVPDGYDLFTMDMSSRDFDTETEPDDLSWEEGRVGDTHWTWIDVDELYCCYHDVLYKDDDRLFYAIRDTGDVHAIDTNGPSPMLRVVLDTKNSLVNNTKYIVLSESGDLLQVRRYYKHVNNDRRTRELIVYKVDLVEQKLAELKDFDGRALFIGFNSSFFLRAEYFPMLTPNSVYCTDDSMEYIYCVGAFHLDDSSFTDQLIGSRLNWPPPIWFRPSFTNGEGGSGSHDGVVSHPPHDHERLCRQQYPAASLQNWKEVENNSYKLDAESKVNTSDDTTSAATLVISGWGLVKSDANFTKVNKATQWPVMRLSADSEWQGPPGLTGAGCRNGAHGCRFESE
uniref:KIB1-4 beta-propeller domain-containing protein n=1 Tax=Oryza meridionalis TaxID=40149 RepID=A0A0E0C157_9ORYZ